MFFYSSFMDAVNKSYYIAFIYLIGSRNKSTGIATDMNWTAGVSFPAAVRFFSSPERPDRILGPAASYTMGIGGSFPGVKVAVM
jgi:hypothetical protein